MKIIYWCIY